MTLKVQFEAYDVEAEVSDASVTGGVVLTVADDETPVTVVTAVVKFVDYVGDLYITDVVNEITETANSAVVAAKAAELKAQTAIDRAESGVKTFDILFLEESQMDALTVDDMEAGVLYCGLAEDESTPSSYDETTGQLTIPNAVFDTETGYMTLPTASFNSSTEQLILS